MSLISQRRTGSETLGGDPERHLHPHGSAISPISNEPARSASQRSLARFSQSLFLSGDAGGDWLVACAGQLLSSRDRRCLTAGPY